MRKLVLIVHTSLDGFVAAPGGDLSCFPSGDENLEFVCQLTKNADATLLGRKSFQLLHQYWPAAKDRADATWNEFAYSVWYNKAAKFVVSRSLQKEGATDVTLFGADVKAEVTCLKQSAGDHILIFGSPTLSQALMQCGLIDEYWVFVNPIVFGEGIPLFIQSRKKMELQLAGTRQFCNGEIALHYTNRQ